MTEPSPIYVVSNVALVMKEFLDCIERQFPDMNFVYDEQLTYETANKAFRRNQEMQGDTDPFFPCFAFRREVLRWQENGQGRRATQCPVLNPDIENDRTFLYRNVSGLLELQFLYLDVSAEHVEKFELIYLSESLLNRKRVLEAEIPELGTFSYSVMFEPLESKLFSIDDNYYKAVSGVVRLKGSFLLFEGTANVIKEINISVQNFNNSVLCSNTIQAE